MRSQPRTIMFDVDGTLLNAHDDSPRLDILDMLKDYQRKGWDVGVWSGSGKGYAEMVGNRLGLEDVTYHSKLEDLKKPDIAVDDISYFTGGKRNIIV